MLITNERIDIIKHITLKITNRGSFIMGTSVIQFILLITNIVNIRETKLVINNNTALMKNTLNTPRPKTILILFFSIHSILSRKAFISYSHRCTY